MHGPQNVIYILCIPDKSIEINFMAKFPGQMAIWGGVHGSEEFANF